MTPAGVTLQHPDCIWIGGAWRKPHSGRSIEIVSPNTEQVVAIVAEADETDMDAAVAAELYASTAASATTIPRMRFIPISLPKCPVVASYPVACHSQ